MSTRLLGPLGQELDEEPLLLSPALAPLSAPSLRLRKGARINACGFPESAESALVS